MRLKINYTHYIFKLKNNRIETRLKNLTVCINPKLCKSDLSSRSCRRRPSEDAAGVDDSRRNDMGQADVNISSCYSFEEDNIFRI